MSYKVIEFLATETFWHIVNGMLGIIIFPSWRRRLNSGSLPWPLDLLFTVESEFHVAILLKVFVAGNVT